MKASIYITNKVNEKNEHTHTHTHTWSTNTTMGHVLLSHLNIEQCGKMVNENITEYLYFKL
jgi:hypothetical protein